MPVAIPNAESFKTAMQGGGIVGERAERLPDGTPRLAPRERILARYGLPGKGVTASGRDSIGGLAQQMQGVVVQSGRWSERVALFLGAQRVKWDSIP
jgi:hypothetical protein